ERSPPRAAAPAHVLDHRMAVFDPGNEDYRPRRDGANVEVQVDHLEHGVALLVRDVRGPASSHSCGPDAALLPGLLLRYPAARVCQLDPETGAADLPRLQPGAQGL